MALIKCFECHTEVSALADTCPNCGAPTEGVLRQEEKRRTSVRTGIFLVLLGVAMVMGGCVSTFATGEIGPSLLVVVIGVTIMYIGAFKTDK